MKSTFHLLALPLCGHILADEPAPAIARQTREISGWQGHIQNKLLESEMFTLLVKLQGVPAAP